MRSSARILAWSILAMLAGCAMPPVSLVGPAQRVAVGDGVSVMPMTGWNRIATGDALIFTKNGPNLDTVHFVTGIKSGAPLVRIPGAPRDATGVFNSKMLPNDVQDLVVGTLEKEGFDNVRSGGLAPCPFGSAPGFCFDLTFATGDGLSMKGKVMAVTREGKLDMIEFSAPAEYYYDALLPDVTRLFASAEVTDPGSGGR